MDDTLIEPLAAAREKFRANDWNAALDLYRQADGSAELAPEDLESMADSAWWSARPDEAIDLLQRAYTAHLQAGNPVRAGYVALTLAREYGVKYAGSISTSWFNRAKKLLEAEPESVELGYLYLRQSSQDSSAGRNDESIEAAKRAVEVGMRVGDANLQALGSVYQGVALVDRGDVEEGLQLIDDATLAAVSGELDIYATGVVYCNTIATCCEIADFGRAREWADAAQRWSASHPQNPLVPGDCRVHQAEVLALRGSWAEAEESARRGAEELRAFNRLHHVGEALYQIGVIRLHLDDLPAARDLFVQASELGRDPQPGLSMLLLAERKADAGLASITRALDEETSSKLSRARLLPAFVDISLAHRRLADAQRAVEELQEIASVYTAPSLQAATNTAHGAVLLAGDDATGAVRALRRAVTGWQEVDAPYDGARARTLLGRAIAQQGDAEGARLELRAARATFERLGAAGDVRITEAALADVERRPESTSSDVRTFMFTDIVSSTNLIEAIGDAAWVDVIRWHDQTLRALFEAHHGEELDHAGDGFFVAFEDREEALACAVAIQRSLADHRRKQGFAPAVRIGLHAVAASRSGGTYRGKGVHEAARIAATAGGGDVVASASTVDGLMEDFPASEARPVSLKGIAQPVDIVTVDWQSASGDRT
jgi:class 3 adenylate cyclase